jgi:hypothetical protein
MRLSRFVSPILLALVAVGLLAACQRAGESDISRTDEGVMRLGSVEVVDTVARAVSLADRPLVLKGLRGSVRLTGAKQATADLSFVHRGRGESRKDGQSVLEGISITESGTEAEYTYTLEADESDYAAVDIQGQVPRQAALRIDRLSGSVDIEGVRGKLTIEHEHGDMRVQGAAAPVEVTIKNGNVEVGFRTVPAEGPIRLETSNGDLRLRLPPDASAQIDARTDAGTIRTQGLSFTAEQFAPVNAGARYDAQLGGGEPTIELRAQNGSITLQARDTTSADTTEAGQRPAPTVPTTDTTIPAPPVPDTAEGDTTSPDTSTTVQDTVSVNQNQ